MKQNFSRLAIVLDRFYCIISLFLIIIVLSTNTLKAQRVKIVENEMNRTIDIFINKKLFTSLFNPGENILKKPVLFPILTAKGTAITRGWPIDPRQNERVDNPGQVGMWQNFGNVNGYDYWNNAADNFPENSTKKYGTIRQFEVVKMESGNKSAVLKIKADWIEKDGKGDLVADETTTYVFSGTDDQRIIDRITIIRADKDLVFNDSEDGFFALRVARQLEQPTQTPEVLTNKNGIASDVKIINNDGVNGQFKSSEGLVGTEVFGTRAKWVNLTGKLDAEVVSVAIIDHPQNIGYPTYWNTKSYGLFAANPLGVNIYNKSEKKVNLTIKAGEQQTFKYRTVITSRNLPDNELNELAKEFSKVQ